MNSITRNTGIGLMMTGVAGGALAAGTAFSVIETVELSAAPAKTWDLLKDFNSWPYWHPAFASTEITKGGGNAPGTQRVLTTTDGAKFTEELVAHDGAARNYQYRIIESPLPLVGYVSTLEVKENHGGSTVIWSSHFDVKPGASGADIQHVISGVYRAGLDHLAARIK